VLLAILPHGQAIRLTPNEADIRPRSHLFTIVLIHSCSSPMYLALCHVSLHLCIVMSNHARSNVTACLPRCCACNRSPDWTRLYGEEAVKQRPNLPPEPQRRLLPFRIEVSTRQPTTAGVPLLSFTCSLTRPRDIVSSSAAWKTWRSV
jgi:hypothetical protein